MKGNSVMNYNIYKKIKQLNWKFIVGYSIGCYVVGFVITALYFIKYFSSSGMKFEELDLGALLPFVLLISIILFVPLTILFGIIKAIFSRKLLLRWKMLVMSLIITIGLLLYINSYYAKSSIQRLPLFSLTDIKAYDPSDNYVTAKGVWLSDAKLGTPIQATQIDCWKDKGYAIVTDAQLLFGGLSINNSYYEIDKWSDDEITFKDSDQSMYCFYRLHIDRKNKAVTLTRFTKQPKPEEARDIQDEPVYMHLGNGRIR
jgi:hypothetical protein